MRILSRLQYAISATGRWPDATSSNTTWARVHVTWLVKSVPIILFCSFCTTFLLLALLAHWEREKTLLFHSSKRRAVEIYFFGLSVLGVRRVSKSIINIIKANNKYRIAMDGRERTFYCILQWIRERENYRLKRECNGKRERTTTPFPL